LRSCSIASASTSLDGAWGQARPIFDKGRQAMKKLTTILAMVTAALSLAACAKKEEAAVSVDVKPEATP